MKTDHPVRLPFSREEQIKRDQMLRRETDNLDTKWILLIKELRVTHGCSILDAERSALSDNLTRRWVQKSINKREKCRKQALAHIRYNGEQAWS